MFTLEELSKAENEMVKNASTEYGAYYENASNLISLMWSFVHRFKLEAHTLFTSFLSQVCVSLSLALLSAIRRHDIQTMHMLRHTLESAVLASYSLYNYNTDDFAVICEDGTCEIKENTREKAYKWLEENYKKYSDTISFLKTKYINKESAHANIGHGFYNTDFGEKSRVNIGFFDGNSQDEEHFEVMTKQRIWFIANIAFGILDLFYQVSKDYPFIEVVEDFELRMHELGNKNECLKKELKSHPKFARRMEPSK